MEREERKLSKMAFGSTSKVYLIYSDFYFFYFMTLVIPCSSLDHYSFQDKVGLVEKLVYSISSYNELAFYFLPRHR